MLTHRNVLKATVKQSTFNILGLYYEFIPSYTCTLRTHAIKVVEKNIELAAQKKIKNVPLLRHLRTCNTAYTEVEIFFYFVLAEM